MTDLISTSEHHRDEYLLLTPTHCPARMGDNFNLIDPTEYLEDILESMYQSRIVAVDFETRGGDYSSPEMAAAGIGFAWDEGNCYFSWQNLSGSSSILLTRFLERHPGLIAHNIYFDGGVAKNIIDVTPKWLACTYSLYSMLANEGFKGRSWGLKTAQVELLLWKNSNERDLDHWLVINGYYKGNKRKDSSYEYLNAEYESGGLSPEKGEMWRAPPDILGKYCCLDAESTYHLYTRILEPALRKFPALDDFCRKHWLNLIDRLVDQKIHGILMDRDGLIAHKNDLLARISKLEFDFRAFPAVREHLEVMQEEKIQKLIVVKEPPRLKKNGDVSKNWINWENRVQEARAGRNEDFLFNLNSGPQMIELLYTRMEFPVVILSDEGAPSVSTKAFSKMGGIGIILIERVDLVKELSYVTKYLELLETRDTMHPSFRTPGTTTGRLSSKEPNLQQVPKNKAMMSLFKARPGHVWVDVDFAALESIIAAEFSQDPNLLALYGNGVPENDIHLFIAAQVPGPMGDKVRATGYTPINPPKGTVSKAKKEAKKERSIAKTVVYACQFGAGVKRVHEQLEEDNIFLPYHEVELIHKAYWETFSVLKDYGRSLQMERRRRKGYILNGLGRPMAIPDEFEKDSLSRFVQSTGHDVLCLLITILTRNMDASGIPWKPVIIDFHDATTIEVPEQYGEQVVQIFNESMDELNAEVRGTIKLRGIPTIGINLSEVKEPES